MLGPAVMALVCLAAVWALWTVTIDALGGLRTGVVLAVHAATVDLRVAGEWEGSERIRLADGRVRIERAALTFSDPRQGFARLPDDAWVDVKAASATLQDLRLEPGTELTLERADGEALAVYAAGRRGGWQPTGQRGRDPDLGRNGRCDAADQEFSRRGPRADDVQRRATQGMPARIVLRPEGPLALRDLAVSGLRFGREAAPSAGRAHIRLHGSGRTAPGPGCGRELRAVGRLQRDLEWPRGAGSPTADRGRRRRRDAIAVDLEGTVERVTVGPRGRERDATPSVLAYLYHNQRLAFLFAAASFVWGALWSLRRLVGA